MQAMADLSQATKRLFAMHREYQEAQEGLDVKLTAIVRTQEKLKQAPTSLQTGLDVVYEEAFLGMLGWKREWHHQIGAGLNLKARTGARGDFSG